MHKKQPLISALLPAAVFIIILAGLGLWAASYIPFEWLKLKLDALSTDGDAERFTAIVHARIIVRLQIAAPVLILLGGLLYAYRNALLAHLPRLWHSLETTCPTLIQDLTQYLRTLLATTDRWHKVALLVLLLLSIAVRVGFLFQPVRHDEAFTFNNYASKPLILGLSNYSFPNNHIFHTFLVHISYLGFGNHLWAIRLPALMAGLLLLPVAYLVIRALYNQRAAILAIGPLTTTSAMIEYSTNARGYTLIGLFFFLLLGLGQFVKTKDNLAAWLLFGLIASLGFYTIPVMLYPFGIVLTWLTASALLNDVSIRPNRFLGRLGISICFTGLLTALFYLPVILSSGLDAIIANRFVKSNTWSFFFTHFPVHKLTPTWVQWNRDFPVVFSATLILGLILSLVYHKKLARHRVHLLLATTGWIVPMLALQRVIPPERVWLFLLPLYLGLACSGLSYFLERLGPFFRRPAITATLSILLALWTGIGSARALTTYYPYGPGTLKDSEQITLFLKDYLHPGDRVLTVATAAPLEYYFNKHTVSPQYFRTDLRQTSRIILVVLEKKYTLEEVMNIARISGDRFGPPSPLFQTKSASLYELHELALSSQQAGYTAVR